MKHGLRNVRKHRPTDMPLAIAALLLSACTGAVGDGVAGPGTGGGSGGTNGSTSTGTLPTTGGHNGGGSAGSNVGGSAGVVGGNGGSGGTASACLGDPVIVPRRLVRLTFNQIGTAVTELLGKPAGDAIMTKYQIGDLSQRSFPPLLSPREGSVITAGAWQKGDGIASTAGQYVFDNFAAVTKCPATPTEACAQTFIASFAERAYRRPLDEAEKASLAQVYTQSIAAGAPIQEAVQYSVYAILQAPQFLYRTEFGAPSAANAMQIPLTSYEQASQLSFFLADAPPDTALMDAAKRGELTTPEQVSAQATRLLATDTAKLNLEAAMLAYFSIGNLDNVVIDQAKFPAWTGGLKDAMYTESEQFFKQTLWSGRVGDLLTSRKTVVNADLAKLYEITIPANATLDANGFASVELPAVRAGLLTQAGFLAARARPDTDSVVGRGLLINATILCASNPPFPTELADAIKTATATLSHATEREKSVYRTTTAPCSSCHASFDPYGLVLESFDAIGKRRTVDPENRPIDPSAKMPEIAGGQVVKDAADMAQALAGNGAFVTCMTRNMMQYALASLTQVEVESCAVHDVAAKVAASSDPSFATLMREIAVSKTLGTRAAGGVQ